MWQPGGVITNHAPIIAPGEWTCMVGVLGPSMRMVTVATWRDGAISEEYIVSKLLKPGAAEPGVSGSPVASIRNQNPALKRLVGAEAGWSCTLERTAGAKLVTEVGDRGRVVREHRSRRARRWTSTSANGATSAPTAGTRAIRPAADPPVLA